MGSSLAFLCGESEPESLKPTLLWLHIFTHKLIADLLCLFLRLNTPPQHVGVNRWSFKVRPVMHICHPSMRAPAHSVNLYVFRRCYTGTFTTIFTYTQSHLLLFLICWSDSRVKSLAEGLVGRYSGNWGYMYKPTHQFVHVAHFCRSHLTDSRLKKPFLL